MAASSRIEGLAFFGAFNPPTVGHLKAAFYAMEKLSLSSVLFVPSKSRYIRDEEGKDFAYSDEARLSMLQTLGKKRPWMAVDNREIESESQPRTYDTLKAILSSTGRRYSLLFGSDKLPELQTGWRHVPEILKEFGIVVLPRNGEDPERMVEEDDYLRSLPDGFFFLPPLPEIQFVSSTKVRQAIASGDWTTVEKNVPEEIWPLLGKK